MAPWALARAEDWLQPENVAVESSSTLAGDYHALEDRHGECHTTLATLVISWHLLAGSSFVNCAR